MEENMRKHLLYVKAAVLTALVSASVSMSAYAGEWKRDDIGWWYQNDDGSYQMNNWFTDIDGKSYYFDGRGYMLSNTTAPDGSKVGADGARIEPVRSLPSNKGDLYYGGLRQVLDSIPLYPQESTGFEDLDALLNSIFAQIITADMDTHDKLKACYDYLITHTVYGQQPYFGSSYHYAYGVLSGGVGVCDDYSAAFSVMARKIGVPMYTAGGSTHKSNGDFTPHAWCQLDYNGVTYIFDPQVEDVIANGRGGSIMYIRFGGTTAQLADKYHYEMIMDDFSQPKGGAGKTITGGSSKNSNSYSDWNNLTDEERMQALWDTFDDIEW
jgi:hypothetical protein